MQITSRFLATVAALCLASGAHGQVNDLRDAGENGTAPNEPAWGPVVEEDYDQLAASLDLQESRSGEIRGPGGGLVEAVGGNSTDRFYDAIETSDGGVAAIGHTYSLGAGGKDILIVKFDNCGDIVWWKVFGDSGSDEGRFIFETHDEHLVFGGWTTSYALGAYSLCLGKLTSSGDWVWGRLVLESAGDANYRGYDGMEVVEDSNYHLVITGYFVHDVTNLENVLMTKFDSSGNHLRTRRYFADALYDLRGYSIVERCTGNYLVAGLMEFSPGDDGVLLFGCDPDLTGQWAWWVDDGSGSTYANSIVRRSDCGFALTGVAEGRVFLSKRDTAVDPLWQRRASSGSSEGYGIVEASDGGIVVAGEHAGTDDDVLLAKLSASGTAVWSRTYGGAGIDRGYALADTFWVAGDTSTWGAGGYDALLIKTKVDGLTCIPGGQGPAFSSWAPVEDGFLTTRVIPDAEIWTWSPETGSGAILQEFVCDDECEEACCLDDGSCQYLTPDDCLNLDPAGDPQGAGTTCEPSGACCLPDGSCIITTEDCCEDPSVDGTYVGDGTICREPQACCLSDGSCVVADPLCCEQDLGGDASPVPYCLGDNNGGGTDDACEPPPNDFCANATVIASLPYSESLWYRLATGDVDVSCNDGLCSSSPHGVWWYYQPAEDCIATINVSGDHTATAIFTGPNCSNLTEVFCSDSEWVSYSMQGGVGHWIMVSKYYCLLDVWPPDPVEITFDFQSCPEIPTLSQWGLIVVGVSVLVAGAIVIGRRRSGPTAAQARIPSDTTNV